MGILGKSKREKEWEKLKKQAEWVLSVFREPHQNDNDLDVASGIIMLMKEYMEERKDPQYVSFALDFYFENNISRNGIIRTRKPSSLKYFRAIDGLMTVEEKEETRAKLKSEFPSACKKIEKRKSELGEFASDICCGEVLRIASLAADSDNDLDIGDDDSNDDELDLGDDDSDDGWDLDLGDDNSDDDELELGDDDSDDDLDLDLGNDDSDETPSELEEKLTKLKKLFDKGLISESDYNKKKNALLEDL